jgi:hypothetical protein
MGVNASIEGSNPSFSVPGKASNGFPLLRRFGGASVASPGKVADDFRAGVPVAPTQIDHRGLDPRVAHQILQGPRAVGMLFVEEDGERCSWGVGLDADADGNTLHGAPDDPVVTLGFRGVAMLGIR